MQAKIWYRRFYCSQGFQYFDFCYSWIITCDLLKNSDILFKNIAYFFCLIRVKEKLLKLSAWSIDLVQYSETCLNRTLNKLKSCVNWTLNKLKSCVNWTLDLVLIKKKKNFSLKGVQLRQVSLNYILLWSLYYSSVLLEWQYNTAVLYIYFFQDSEWNYCCFNRNLFNFLVNILLFPVYHCSFYLIRKVRL
jgi:hypothetical protein